MSAPRPRVAILPRIEVHSPDRDLGGFREPAQSREFARCWQRSADAGSRRVDSIRVKSRWHPEGTWLPGLGMGLRRLFGSGSSILDPAITSFSSWVLCLVLWTLELISFCCSRHSWVAAPDIAKEKRVILSRRQHCDSPVVATSGVILVFGSPWPWELRVSSLGT